MMTTTILVLIGGGREDETRFAGRIALGPEAANVGIDYLDLRGSTTSTSGRRPRERRYGAPRRRPSRYRTGRSAPRGRSGSTID